jgi:trimethylamine monooxygenase
MLHSIQVVDYMEYKGDRVLVIGTGLSAEDAVLQCYKYGAKSVTVTYRTRPMPQKIPS